MLQQVIKNTNKQEINNIVKTKVAQAPVNGLIYDDSVAEEQQLLWQVELRVAVRITSAGPSSRQTLYVRTRLCVKADPRNLK